MISKAKQKLIRSLQQKKQRKEQGLFVAEGPKVVGDLMEYLTPKLIVATADWMRQHNVSTNETEVFEVTEDELSRTSLLQNPQEVIGVFSMISTDENGKDVPYDELSIALDDIQDPGNLGTIIRIADWFGISRIYCSMNTADIYNPKVVQATMGSLARVRVTYTDLPSLLQKLPENFPVYGTFLDGKDIYEEQELGPSGMIVMGNEGNGISTSVAQHVTHRLLIPNFPKGRSTADSLNVAIATAVTCAEFRRRAIFNPPSSMFNSK